MRARRVAVPLLAAIAVAAGAWPTVGQSSTDAPLPTPEVASSPLDGRPRSLAPAGWLVTAAMEPQEGRDAVTVRVTSPGGEQRTIARLRDVARSIDGSAARLQVLTVLPVTVEGMLPIVLETSDAGAEGRAIRVHDLLGTDPQVPVLDLHANGERWFPLETATSGPDGRISWTDDGPDGDGTALLDPDTGRLTVLRAPRGRSVVREDAWLASGAGWPASSETGPGIVTTAGTFRPTSPPLPLLDLSRGARQISLAGKTLATLDRPTSSVKRSDPRSCPLWWTATEDPSVRPTEVWWSRCTDRGRLLDIRWDVDGEGVLALQARGGRLELVRRDEPGVSTVLAAVRDARLAGILDGTTGVEVLGLAPGPRPYELLLAFRPSDRTDTVFFLSTIDVTLREAAGQFAGFSTTSLDTTPTGPG